MATTEQKFERLGASVAAGIPVPPRISVMIQDLRRKRPSCTTLHQFDRLAERYIREHAAALIAQYEEGEVGGVGEALHFFALSLGIPMLADNDAAETRERAAASLRDGEIAVPRSCHGFEADFAG